MGTEKPAFTVEKEKVYDYHQFVEEIEKMVKVEVKIAIENIFTDSVLPYPELFKFLWIENIQYCINNYRPDFSYNARYTESDIQNFTKDSSYKMSFVDYLKSSFRMAFTNPNAYYRAKRHLDSDMRETGKSSFNSENEKLMESILKAMAEQNNTLLSALEKACSTGQTQIFGQFLEKFVEIASFDSNFEKIHLCPRQKEVVESICGPKRVVVVKGKTGTGKTSVSVMGALKFLGNKLYDDKYIQYTTLGGSNTHTNTLNASVGVSAVKSALRPCNFRGLTLGENVLIVDEAQLADYSDIYVILSRLSENGKIVILGDSLQGRDDTFDRLTSVLQEQYGDLVDVIELDENEFSSRKEGSDFAYGVLQSLREGRKNDGK